MLAKIGDFTFDINGTNFESLKSTLNFKFATHERVGNFNTYQNVGKYEEKFEISGILLCKSQKELVAFEDMAKAKKEVLLVFANDTRGKAYKVLITDISEDKSSFLKDGQFLKQSYSISMQKVGE